MLSDAEDAVAVWPDKPLLVCVSLRPLVVVKCEKEHLTV